MTSRTDIYTRELLSPVNNSGDRKSGAYNDDSLQHARNAWNVVKDSSEIFEVIDYLQNNPKSCFEAQAREIFMSLNDQEIRQMRSCSYRYNRERLISIFTKGIISEKAFISERVSTPNILRINDIQL